MDTKNTAKESASSLTPIEKNKRLIKKLFIIILAATVVLLLLYFGSKLILDKITEKDSIVQIDETYRTFNFYPAEDKSKWKKTDIFSDKEYLSLDYKPSVISSSLGGVFLLDDIPKSLENEGHRFFKKYFSMLQSGSYELYPSLFSDKYKKNLSGFEKNVNREFPPQMVYDIKIEEAGRLAEQIVDGKSCVVSAYWVSYKIFKNTGLFRNDIGRDIDLDRDIARPLLFELITTDAGTENEKTLINNLYTESSIAAKAGGEK